MPTIGEVNVRVGATIDQMVKGLRGAERELLRSGRKLKRLGDDMTTNISLPLGAIGALGFKMSKDLQTSFSKIENLVGVTGQQLQSFKKDVKEVSGDVGKSQTELSKALFTITSAGEKGAAALEVLTSSSKGSVIGLGETKNVAKVATAVLQAYGKENYNAAQSVNILAKTVKAGNLEAEELAPSLGKVIPLAAQLDISFEELGSNIALYTKLGVSASESTNSLKAVLSNIIKPSEKAKEVLAKYGLTIKDVKESISKNGLGATLQELIKTFDGNVESIGEMFGSVEGLANVLGTAGLQSETYNEILAEMSNGVDIVEKGFQKASQTADQKWNKALVRMQNRAIEIGNIVLPIFTDIIDVVGRWAERFGQLDASTQRSIVKIGAFVAAIGPVIKIIGVMKTTYAGVLSAQQMFLVNLKKVSAGLLVAAARFKAMDLVMRATVIGAVTAAIAAAVVVFQNWNKEITLAQKNQKNLQDINTQAAQSIVEEKIQVERLVAIYKDSNRTLGDRQLALQELRKISPQYFGGLDTEKSKIEDVTAAMDGYIANILKMAKVQAAKERIVELNKELLDTEGILDKTEMAWNDWEAIQIRATSIGEKRNKALGDLWGKRANQYKDGLQGQIEELSKFIAMEDTMVKNRPTVTTSNFTLGSGTPTVDPSSSSPAAPAISNPSEETKLIFEKVSAVESLAAVTMQAKLATDALTLSNIESVGAGMEALAAEQQRMEVMQAMTEAARTATAAIVNYADQGGKSLKELGKIALKSAADFIRAQIKKAIASFIASKIGAGPLGLIVAGAGAAIVGTLFNKALGAVNVPALAQGGLASAPTLAMVGDNPNASVDPEVIAPLSKLKSMMGGMAQRVEVVGRIVAQGDQLLVVIENAERNRLRTRGF